MRTADFIPSLRRTLIALLICTLAVVLCYLLVDRPVAYFVNRHKLDQFQLLKWLTYPPPQVQAWSPLVLALLVIRRGLGPWQRWQSALFVACVSLIVADQFRESLGHLCGRYWPETWHDNNPSLLGTGAYGFQPFHSSDDAGSFPSGHAARILAFITVLWIALPRGRWIYAILAAPLLVALVGMNYHFVSDVIAGGVLGSIVGAYAAKLATLAEPDAAITAP